MQNKTNLDEGKNSRNKNSPNNITQDKLKQIDQKENKNYSKLGINNNSLDNKILKKDLTEFKNNKEKESLKGLQNKMVLKNLKQKENSLINEINSIKKIRNEMQDISYNNISQAKIDNTLHNNEIKNLNNIENNYAEKLKEIQRQIKDLSKNDNYTSNNRNQKGFPQISHTNNFNNIYKGSINKVKLIEQNEMRLMEIQKEYKNKQKILSELEEKSKNQKLKYLIEQRKKEMEIIQKRKKEADEKMKDIKNKMKPPPNEKDCLYYKMEQNFQENEKKLLHKITTERKVKNIYYKQNVDIDNIKSEFQNFKNQLQQRAIEQTNNIKKIWHSRSMIMKQYETNMMKTFKENEEFKANNEKIMKLTKKGLFLDKEIYGKKKVHLPPIDEKLKEESIKNQIDIKNLKGKERINYVNEKYMTKGLKIRNINKNFDYGKKYVFKNSAKKKKNPNFNAKPNSNSNANANSNVIINQQQLTLKNQKLINEYEKLGKSISSENIMNKNNLKKKLGINKNEDNKINNNTRNINNNINAVNKVSSSADKIRVRRNPKEINYLNYDRDKENKRYHKWDKYILKSNSKSQTQDIDMEGIENINKQIEKIDEKINMGNEIINLKGGYENDITLGNKLNNMLIDSIKGKLAVINEFCKDVKDKKS